MELNNNIINIIHPTKKMVEVLNRLRDRKVSQMDKLRNQEKCTFDVVL